MAQRLLRALSPFRRRSAAQKAQEAKEEEERKAQLLKDKEDLEAGGPFSRARTDEERKLQAARRKEHEVARAQLFAGREEAPIKANGIHEGEGRNGEESRTVGSSPSRARGVGPPGKFRDGGPRENGALRQENGTGRFRFENGDAERAQMKESPGNFSPVSPLTAAASSSSSSPSLQGVPMNGTSSPLSDRASPPQGGKPKPSEGSFSSPLSGNPLLSTLSELSKNSVQPTSTAQDAGETKRPLARPLNISFMGSYNRERAESDELKEGARAASPRPRGGADPDVQKELVKTPAREEVKQTSTQVKQHTAEVKQTSLEVKIPEPVEEPEGPTAASPFRLTTSPIYMPPEPKVRRPLPPREEHEDEIPWAKDSMMRRGGWASMIMDESTYNLPRIAVRVSSPDTGLGGGRCPPGLRPRGSLQGTRTAAAAPDTRRRRARSGG
ncbi:hypothetical protein KFL_003850070 [Klebsormidium nitens]|uniref:Uncharacterized protein n=1 Tax=Klebsormidium nitens TaxID=105231 RepID=A0A1Y1IGN2_KLENI|nr:hypothetical protein KFL_003850070 [Klebsormidium nitens]|eukprot:GAQ87886.1 hypothetical protein KFL_003850070 [Klebsormidium nitens]